MVFLNDAVSLDMKLWYVFLTGSWYKWNCGLFGLRGFGTHETLAFLDDMVLVDMMLWSFWMTWFRTTWNCGLFGWHGLGRHDAVIFLDDVVSFDMKLWSVWMTWFSCSKNAGVSHLCSFSVTNRRLVRYRPTDGQPNRRTQPLEESWLTTKKQVGRYGFLNRGLKFHWA